MMHGNMNVNCQVTIRNVLQRGSVILSLYRTLLYER